MPVPKIVGDSVFGSTVNQGGVLLVKATGVGKDSAVSQIVSLVQEAQTSRPPMQEFVDKVSAVFVPVVVCIAVVTVVAWVIAGSMGAVPSSWLPKGQSHVVHAVLFGVAVVVVACPCALGLAAPTAVMVGTGIGAANGVLIKVGGEWRGKGRAWSSSAALVPAYSVVPSEVPKRHPAHVLPYAV